MAKTRRGFSLVEMLVVISLITLILSITMPALSRARESGRDAQCKSNLRQLGMGIIQYSDSHTNLSSGAWDWKYDGCVTETGWVADLVSSGIPVDQLKCTSNPIQMHEQFQTLLTMDPSTNTCTNSLGSTARLVDGAPVDNVCREFRLIPAPTDRVGRLQKMIEG
ncbi:MAG: type II secretion system protein, partial [Planctomycetaceae bacterium]|nr:type II secretion system protein [Planctomycetaceae bacterium]